MCVRAVLNKNLDFPGSSFFNIRLPPKSLSALSVIITKPELLCRNLYNCEAGFCCFGFAFGVFFLVGFLVFWGLVCLFVCVLIINIF